jgi:hypothetical protein
MVLLPGYRLSGAVAMLLVTARLAETTGTRLEFADFDLGQDGDNASVQKLVTGNSLGLLRKSSRNVCYADLWRRR